MGFDVRDIDRMVNLGNLIWSFLTEDERDMLVIYDGTLGFVEKVIMMICPDFNFTDNTIIAEYIHHKIFQVELPKN
jgi:hypothetical protein